MIRATPADSDAIMAYLLARSAVAMFPITNLRDFGMAGGHGKAMTFWTQSQDGVLTDVLGITDAGIVLPVFTSDTVPDVAAALAGRCVTGVIGQAGPVGFVKQALGLPDGDLNRVEPHFELSLDRLRLPDTTGLQLIPAGLVPRETLIVWRTQYGIDALDMSPAEAALQAGPAVDAMAAKGTHRVLMRGDRPLAMTGFNAVLPETVMIGGVYTPADLRGNGHARAAVAMHLAEARENGVRRAVLSAANAPAARTYTAIGFRQIGEFMIVLYNSPQVIHG